MAQRDAEMCALRDQGLTYREIGERLGVCYQTAQRGVSRSQRIQNEREAIERRAKTIPVEEMKLRDFLTLNNAPTRLTNTLIWYSGYDTVADLLQATEKELLTIPWMGKKLLAELRAILQKHKLVLKNAAIQPPSNLAQPLRDFLLQNNASPHLFHPLVRCNRYQTLADLLQATEKDLLRLPDIGGKSVQELQTILQMHDLQLRVHA